MLCSITANLLFINVKIKRDNQNKIMQKRTLNTTHVCVFVCVYDCWFAWVIYIWTKFNCLFKSNLIYHTWVPLCGLFVCVWITFVCVVCQSDGIVLFNLFIFPTHPTAIFVASNFEQLKCFPYSCGFLIVLFFQQSTSQLEKYQFLFK